MNILFLIDKLLFRAIKGNNLHLAARNLLFVVVIYWWKVRHCSKITPRYLHWSDYGKSASLSALLCLPLLASIKREKGMNSDFLTLIATHEKNREKVKVHSYCKKCILPVVVGRKIRSIVSK